MGDAASVFVQFPHPGKEHRPESNEMAWNTEEGHRRKFLIAPGRCLDGDGRCRDEELVFWGEWEPPSRVQRRWPRSGRMPRTLHRPYWAEPRGDEFRQNTDPWVFGERMIYSVCRQTKRDRIDVSGPPRHTRTSLQRLARGSIVCFGSTIDRQFCVDTVFVVASAERWTPAGLDSLDLDDAFKICTGLSVATKPGEAHRPLTLYRGATFDDPVEGMFSFVPVRPAGLDDPRFSRPSVESSFINPKSTQSTRGSKHPLPIRTLKSAWGELCEQVLTAGLLLGVWFQTPSYERGGVSI